MITTLLFDFNWVLSFPYSRDTDSSSAYKQARLSQHPWQKYLELNDELIKFVKKQNNLNSYIFSASSKNMLKEMKFHLIPPFIEIFSSKELGLYKHQSESYRQIVKILNTAPEKILFIDDNDSNIEAAQIAGMQTIHYQNNQDFIKRFQLLINSN